MHKNGIKRIFAILLSFVIIFGLSIPSFAEGEKGKAELFKNSNGRLMSVAHKGDFRNFPENSLEGVISAVNMGVDIVEVDVQKTSDGVIILMDDESFSRTCVDPLGNSFEAKVSETESWEVIAMHLKEGQGGITAKATEYAPPTLEAVINAVKGKALLLVDCDWELKDNVNSLIALTNSFDTVIIKVDGEKRALSKWLSDLGENAPMTMGGYSGNIITSARGYVKKTLTKGSFATVLSVKNPYGVIFNQSVLKLFDEKGRAAIDTTNTGLCGGREDNEIGWNDLTSRGYSIIITDYPERLVSYIKSTEAERQALEVILEKAKQIDLTLYSAAAAKGMNNKIKSTQEMLDGSFSKQTLNEQYYSLQSSIDNLMQLSSDEINKGKASTSGKVIAVIFVSVVFIVSQLWIYKKSLPKKVKKKTKTKGK